MHNMRLVLHALSPYSLLLPNLPNADWDRFSAVASVALQECVASRDIETRGIMLGRQASSSIFTPVVDNFRRHRIQRSYKLYFKFA